MVKVNLFFTEELRLLPFIHILLSSLSLGAETCTPPFEANRGRIRQTPGPDEERTTLQHA